MGKKKPEEKLSWENAWREFPGWFEGWDAAENMWGWSFLGEDMILRVLMVAPDTVNRYISSRDHVLVGVEEYTRLKLVMMRWYIWPVLTRHFHRHVVTYELPATPMTMASLILPNNKKIARWFLFTVDHSATCKAPKNIYVTIFRRPKRASITAICRKTFMH
jgi:hypothetical protein